MQFLLAGDAHPEEGAPEMSLEEESARSLISAAPDTTRARPPYKSRALVGAVGAVALLALLGVTVAPGQTPQLAGAGVAVASTRAANISASVGLLGEGCGARYAQCGGKTFSGTTCCQAGCACMPSGEYYSKCTPIEGSDTCDPAKAHEKAQAMLPDMMPLKAAAKHGAMTKAAAAEKAAKLFAQAAAAMQQAAEDAEAEATACQAVQGAAADGLEPFVKAMEKAVSASNAQMVTGKKGWAAGDKALKAEAARIKVALDGDDAFGKLQEGAHKMGLWLGASGR